MKHETIRNFSKEIVPISPSFLYRQRYKVKINEGKVKNIK